MYFGGVKKMKIKTPPRRKVNVFCFIPIYTITPSKFGKKKWRTYYYNIIMQYQHFQVNDTTIWKPWILYLFLIKYSSIPETPPRELKKMKRIQNQKLLYYWLLSTHPPPTKKKVRWLFSCLKIELDRMCQVRPKIKST